jgi:folate-dependent phosphoribosylglycinamide formyltransferase PurN
MDYLTEHDPHRGLLYEIVCCLSSHQGSAAETQAEKAGVPFLTHSIHDFCRTRGKPIRDLALRRDYDAETVALLAPFRPDVVVLSSYLYILTEPMLSFFRRRILNIHHSDLTLRNSDGSPRYVGLLSVRDAVFAGETETRATVHIANEGLDDGPLYLRSWPFPISPLTRDARAWEAVDALKAYAYAHQEWMLRSAWGPLMASSLELLATGRAILGDAAAYVDGVPGPIDLERWELDSGKNAYRLLSPPSFVRQLEAIS